MTSGPMDSVSPTGSVSRFPCLDKHGTATLVCSWRIEDERRTFGHCTTELTYASWPSHF